MYTDNFLIDNIPNLLCIKDHKDRWLQASPICLKYYKIENISYIGKTNYELSQYDQSNLHALRLSDKQEKKAWETRKPVKTKRTFKNNGGIQEKFEFTTKPVFDQQGNRSRLFITGSVTSEDIATPVNQSLFAAIFQCQHINILIVDHNLRIIHINKAATLLTGFSSLKVKGRTLALLFDTNNTVDFNSINHFDFINNIWQAEAICRKKDNSQLPVKISISPVSGGTLESTQYCVTLEDISEQKNDVERLSQITHQDDLTGLGNRILFFDVLNKFISAAKRHTFYAVVFFIDLDNFKSVNDSLGHDAGDELLKQVANRLQAIVRGHDIVARLSGDEFTLLMLNEKSNEKAVYEASMIAKKIIASLSEEFDINHHQIFIGCSIGISIFPEDGLSCEVLLKHADLAMYEAKKQGRNNYQFYKKSYTAAIKDKIALSNRLRRAIENNELHLFYQPQYEAKSRKLWGAEVLLRWVHDARGQNKMIPPDQFIPIAEETGLIIEIGQWVLERACKQHMHWLRKGYSLPRISVNISARQFMDNDFISTVVDILNKSQLPPNMLELEMTESMLMGDTKLIELKLKRLKGYGVSIALDDFGTGYSSLSYLKNFPIDILKIDQSFIREMYSGSKDARIARAIIEMGHSLGQKVIAEGVENENQLRLLVQTQCDIIQGYLFSKPLSRSEMEQLLIKQAKPVKS